MECFMMFMMERFGRIFKVTVVVYFSLNNLNLVHRFFSALQAHSVLFRRNLYNNFKFHEA